MSTPRLLVFVCWFVSAAAWSLEASSPASKAVAARVQRDSIRCAKYADLNACDDAIRWNPSDPALLAALADALVRAKRPADAIRHYRRAAEIAPAMPGLAAKISDTEKKLAPERREARRKVPPVPRAAADPKVAHAPASIAVAKRFTNADPETQSH